MNEQTIQLLRDLATKLGTTTEQLMIIMRQQVHAEIIVGTALTCIFFILLPPFVYLFIHGIRKSYDGCAVIGMMFGFLALACFLFNAYDTISMYLSPEYFALQRLLESLGKLR